MWPSVRLPQVIILASLFLWPAQAKDPKVHRHGFKNLPRKYTYFEDSSSILFLDERSGTIFLSADDGTTWKTVSDIPQSLAASFFMHPFDAKVAFVLGAEKEHYRTDDLGKSWHKFSTDAPPSTTQNALDFNAQDTDQILFAGEHCDDKGGLWGTNCYDHTYYTTDSFRSKPVLLKENTHSCVFAHTTKLFNSTAKSIFCIDEDKDEKRKFPMNLRLVASNDHFKTEFDVSGDTGPLRGVVGLGAVQSFIIAATKSPGSENMALYVTHDGLTWDTAEFPNDHEGLKEDGYTILESRPYGIQVDVMSSEHIHNSFGALYASNSNGTYFTKNLDFTNRNEIGIVDFENVENIEGIVLANIVANSDDILRSRKTEKKIQSRISFDDGRTWESLRAPSNSECDPDDSENCSLHLYSAASPHNVGRIFSSTAPGLLMGVGSVGSALLPYFDCNLYISEDAGLTWRMTRKDAHKYEWGDQGGILLAVYDEDTTEKLFYSFDRGRKWKTLDLGMKVRAKILTTVPDSTTEKFTLVASRGKGEDSDDSAFVFSVDFTGVRTKKCRLDKTSVEKSDFEKWYARYDAGGKPACLMGHKQYFWRKKADRDCFVGELYHEPQADQENCPCEAQDYECDYNFVKEGDSCVQASGIDLPESACREGSTSYTVSSGYRLIPGNTCDKQTGLKKDGEVVKSCDDVASPDPETPATGKVSTRKTDFKGHYRHYFYLEQSKATTEKDETLIMQIDSDNVFLSHNHGQTWKQILEDDDVVATIPNKYFSDIVYFLTPSTTAFISKDRGETLQTMELPTPPNNLRKAIFDFHSSKPNWLIFTGMKCESEKTGDCRAVSYYTQNGGSSWTLLHDYVDSCQYIGTTKVDADTDLVYCAASSSRIKSSAGLSLFASTDYFESSTKLFETIIGYAVFEEFIVVAEVYEESNLRMHASVDGRVFAHGHFPPKFNVDHQQAYTVLDSVTRSIFLHVTVNSQTGREWGSILKSNSNGTYFVTSVDQVNRNTAGFVDFEKLLGLEGVAIVNVVINEKEVYDGQRKQLRTKMTHNDGGEWSFLRPPEKDSTKKAFACKGSVEICSLNLHGYTERVDIRDTYSSGSAIGILLGVGNVGGYLSTYDEADTFMSSDGGITWTEIHKGPYQWEFGDQGSIVVIVKDGEPTDRVLYTLDEGKSWQEHIFSDVNMIVRDIATIPSDSSQKFLLFAKPDSKKDEMVTVALDFAGLRARKCVLQQDSNSKGDFYLWTPTHPSNEDKCLFGHVSEYYRKRPEADCYIGTAIDVSHQTHRNCTCSIYDFECDYNYQRASDGTCQLIPGLDPPDHSAICTEDDINSWTEPTGYRKIPLTTCEGGKAFDLGTEHACSGKEDQYRKNRKGLHGFWLFVVVMLPFAAAGYVGYYVWTTVGGRALGQIRLGDDPFENEITYGSERLQAYISHALSGLIGVLHTVPLVIGMIWNVVGSKLGFMSRHSRSAYYDPLSTEGLLSDDEDILDDEF